MLQMINGNELQGILGVMVPIVAIVGGLSLAFANNYMRSRERLEMISRGIDVSAMNNKHYNWPKRRRSPLRFGMMVFGAGIGLLLAYVLCGSMGINEDDRPIIYGGFVATFVGLGIIISHLVEKNDRQSTGSNL